MYTDGIMLINVGEGGDCCLTVKSEFITFAFVCTSDHCFILHLFAVGGLFVRYHWMIFCYVI